MNYIGQIFGNRKVIANTCTDEDWEKCGFKIPSRPDKYLLTECMSCGSVLPCEISNMKRRPPKRCVFCSNIGNHNKVKTNTNNWTVYDEYAVCNISYGKGIVSCYVDADQFDVLSNYVWRVVQKRQKYYVITGSFKKNTAIYMHDMIVGIQHDGFEIDHIDGNSLNNRRENLRIVTRQENIDNQRATRIDNQIGIRGIVYSRSRGKYKVDFYHHNHRLYFKEWNTIEEAVWCRYCLEDFFGIESIKHNPIAQEYFTLDDSQKKIIRDYVLSQILGNER